MRLCKTRHAASHGKISPLPKTGLTGICGVPPMRKIWLTLLMWPLIVLPINAQRASGASTGYPASAASPAPITQVTLGQSTVALNGPWKFRVGDNPEWSAPDFDDSAWGTMDLTPPPGSYDPITGNSGFVPATPAMRGIDCGCTFKTTRNREKKARWRSRCRRMSMIFTKSS